jgi:ubiquinone/menaquinone biosynthesis C-methylase UbiE
MRRPILKIQAVLLILILLTSNFSNRVLIAGETNSKTQIEVLRKNQKYLIAPEEFDYFDFQSGDQLIVKPAEQLLKTPDGHLHVKTQQGMAIRIPEQITLTPFNNFFIPEHLCILTGAGSHALQTIGQKHIENYIKYMGLWPEMTFLEIGCGIGRDAFQLLSILNPSGKYIGVDVTRDSIVWLQKNITSICPNFLFYHFDAKHELYNPLGSKKSTDFALPAEDQSVDRIALGSVFTHLFEDEIVHYLFEIKRVLKPDGLAYATFFIYEDEAIRASRINNATPFNLRFEHPYGQGCFVNDPVYKTGAVSYTYEALTRMINKAGLKLVHPLIRGCWSGLFQDSDDGQDVAILGLQ